ncbi:hypothetical protein V2W30_22535 [Streptomyces sp. Q6]|uniref:Uncharacterized protein n=1 Tax=Streptomyces citrinus TaxID=3118173 RepID=A0ACD5AF28_9ACTN
MTTDRPSDMCKTFCVACITDESHDPAPRSAAPAAEAERRAEIADDVTAKTKELLTRRTETLRRRAERAEAEVEQLRVDRAAVLLEAAAAIDATFTGPGNDRYVRYGADLLRRMADEAQQPETAERPLSPYYEHPACGFHWHGRDSMDIPMRDGQPVCPRCELEQLRAHTAAAGKVLTTTSDRLGDAEAEVKRLRAVERLCSGRPGYHTVTVKALLTAMSAAAEAQQAEPAPNELAPMFEGLARLLATSSRDWQLYRVDAWLYAVLVGWDCEQATHDEWCTHGALEETAAMHGWDADTVAKARRYRTAVRAITEGRQS